MTLMLYGQTRVSCLPGLAAWVVDGNATRAYALAAAIHASAADVPDAITNITTSAPLGVDIAAAFQCAKASAPVTGCAYDALAALQAAYGPISPDAVDPEQVFVPFVLRTELLLTAADTREVLKHLRAGDEPTAAKLAQQFGRQTAAQFPLQLQADRQWTFDPAVLRARLQGLVTTQPAVLYRACVHAKLIGPGAPPMQLQGYAEWVRQAHEGLDPSPVGAGRQTGPGSVLTPAVGHTLLGTHR